MACRRITYLFISVLVFYRVAIVGSIMEDRSKDELRFVSVVFRHGSRAPSSTELKFLPDHGQSYNNFYPIGLGGLTNEGKQAMYKLGTELRKRYDNFLGDVYFPDHVEARSTDIPRAKTSLSLLLAGLYPPSEVQMWNPELKWQPIPSTSVPISQDIYLTPWICSPKYIKLVEQIESLPEVVKKVEVFRPLTEKLTNLTGTPVTSTLDMWFLYNYLMALRSVNYTLPAWADGIFPDGALLHGTLLRFEVYNHNDLLMRFSGGMLLKQIIDNMNTATKSGCSTNAQKIALISTHDVNIVALLAALGLYKPHVPEYSSAIIIELIRRDEDYYVRIIRYLGTPDVFVEQEISDCGTLCPFDKFLDLTKKVTPSDEEIDAMPEGSLPPLAAELS